MSQMADRLVQALEGASGLWTDDRLNHFGTGTKFEAFVKIDAVMADVSVNQSVEGVGHVEKFTVTGKWEARVRKDKYQLGRIYDKIWGDHETPYGFFTVQVNALDGTVAGAPSVEITVEDPDLEPKQYALSYAEELVRKKISEVIG